MFEYQRGPFHAARVWRIVLGAIALGGFLFVLLSALYVVDSLFNM